MVECAGALEFLLASALLTLSATVADAGRPQLLLSIPEEAPSAWAQTIEVHLLADYEVVRASPGVGPPQVPRVSVELTPEGWVLFAVRASGESRTFRASGEDTHAARVLALKCRDWLMTESLDPSIDAPADAPVAIHEKTPNWGLAVSTSAAFADAAQGALGLSGRLRVPFDGLDLDIALGALLFTPKTGVPGDVSVLEVQPGLDSALDWRLGSAAVGVRVGVGLRLLQASGQLGEQSASAFRATPSVWLGARGRYALGALIELELHVGVELTPEAQVFSVEGVSVVDSGQVRGLLGLRFVFWP